MPALVSKNGLCRLFNILPNEGLTSSASLAQDADADPGSRRLAAVAGRLLPCWGPLFPKIQHCNT